MVISKNFLAECIIRNYALKELGWTHYFDLKDFPKKEAYKNLDLALAMDQLGLLSDWKSYPIDVASRNNSFALHIIGSKGELYEMYLDNIFETLPDEGDDMLVPTTEEEDIIVDAKEFSFRRCKRCGSYFMVTDKKNQEFCDRSDTKGRVCSALNSWQNEED